MSKTAFWDEQGQESPTAMRSLPIKLGVVLMGALFLSGTSSAGSITASPSQEDDEVLMMWDDT